MLPLDRSRRERAHLEWRVRLFAVAAVVGLAGIYFDDGRLTGAAIVLLLVGLALRFARSAGDGRAGHEDDEADGAVP